MKTILVPTDFSDTAKNAALYAISFAKQMKSEKIILYNAYQTPPVVDINMGMIEAVDLDLLQQNSENNLESFKNLLAPYLDATTIELETLSDYGMVSTDINDVCDSNDIDVIVMGVTGAGKVAETFIGSYAVDVSETAEVPVIIVPPGSGFTAIEEVMLACDFTKVEETLPVEPIKNILDATSAKLFVINIDHNKESKPDTPFESLVLDKLLAGYKPEYHFINDVDFVEAINNFAHEKEVDLIITIPKKMGWFNSLFKRNHTAMLAFHSHVPIMVVHE